MESQLPAYLGNTFCWSTPSLSHDVFAQDACWSCVRAASWSMFTFEQMGSTYEYLLLHQLVKCDLVLKLSTSSLYCFSSVVQKARKRKQGINSKVIKVSCWKINAFMEFLLWCSRLKIQLQQLSHCRGMDLIPSPVQWAKDLILLQLAGLGCSCCSDSVSGPGNSTCCRCSHLKRKKEKKEGMKERERKENKKERKYI